MRRATRRVVTTRSRTRASPRRPGAGIVLALLVLLLAAPLAAQAVTGAGAQAPETLEERHSRVAQELAAARARLEAARQRTGLARPEFQTREVELLERVQLGLDQYATALQDKQAAEADLARTEQELAVLASTTRPAVAVPFAELETLRDARDEEVERGQLIRTELRSLQTASRFAARQADELKRRLAAVRQTARSTRDENAMQRFAEELRLVELQLRAAEERARARNAELEVAQVRDHEHQRRLEVAEREIGQLRENVVFSEREKQSIVSQLETQRLVGAELDVMTDQLQDELMAVTMTKAEAARRLREPDAAAVVGEELAYYSLAQQYLTHKQRSIERANTNLEKQKELWELRYEVFNGTAEVTELGRWGESVAEDLRLLTEAHEVHAVYLSEDLRRMFDVERALAQAPEPARAWIQRQKEELDKLVALHDMALEGLVRARRVCERLAAEIDEEASRLTFTDRLRSFAAAVSDVWNYQIWEVTDGRYFTVKQLVVGLALLIFGFYASRILSALLGRRLLSRFNFAKGAVAAVQSISFYVLLLIFTLFALRTVNVPLTVFTLFGGAIAIGVGFGSQNIINNFISGLILLVERPVNVGDLVQIGEMHGTIDHIGARSTRVKTGANVEIVVPNSAFLEQNVINWTLSDSRVRVSVSVGVAYGSPLREVRALLEKAVDEHGRVLKSPDPFVLFSDFGSDSLQFQVHFWILMRTVMDRERVLSDIRFRIDGLFREAGIVIAFPQRDVHIHPSAPLPVQVLAPASDAAPFAGTLS